MNCQHLTSKRSRNVCEKCTNPVSNRKDEEMYFLEVFSFWVLGKNSIINELSMVKIIISVKVNHNKDSFPEERTSRKMVFVKNLSYRVY